MFVICDIGPSGLPCTDLDLLKSSARNKGASKGRYGQFSKFSYKDINDLVLLASFNICKISFKSFYTSSIQFTYRNCKT